MTHDPINLIESKIEKSFADPRRDSDRCKLRIKMFKKEELAAKILKRKLVSKGRMITSTYVPEGWKITEEVQKEMDWLKENNMALI